MQALTIVKHDEIVKDPEYGVGPCFWGFVREAFFFQTPEHSFHNGIIITITLPTHAADHPGGLELVLILGTRILTATIRVMHETGRGLPLPHGHVEGPRDQACDHRRRTSPPHDFAGKQIHHNRNIEPPFLGPEGRDITAPHSIRSGHGKLTVEHVGGNGRGMPTVRGGRTAVHSPWVHVRLAHQRPGPMAAPVTPHLLQGHTQAS